MDNRELEDDQLRQRKQYPGRYVAWLDGRVISSAETYGQLSDQLDQVPIEQEARATVEYIEPIDVARVWHLLTLLVRPGDELAEGRAAPYHGAAEPKLS